MATLELFLKTGELGPIHSGMSRAEVISQLGPPQDESVARDLLKYGGLQLAFHKRPGAADRPLIHIGLYFSPCAEPIPESVRPTDFAGTPETTITQMRAFFAQVGLNEAVAVEGEGADSMALPSGARIAFDAQKLHSIHFTCRASRPTKKQLSVALSEDTFIQLRELARQSKRSVAELCAEWITQRAHELRRNQAVDVGHRS
jgi:hypothetical protein